MQTITLYRYSREGGGITVSPIKPDGVNYEIRYRLIADEGKTLVNGDITAECVDVDSAEGWNEIVCPDVQKVEEI